jgi:hypothetical protein
MTECFPEQVCVFVRHTGSCAENEPRPSQM